MSENNTYAIVRHGGKQYKAIPGSKLKIDKIDAKPGDEFVLSDVLTVVKDSQIESLDPKNAQVKTTVLRHSKAKKLIVFKKKRRKGYTKKQGHRQDGTEVLVEVINS